MKIQRLLHVSPLCLVAALAGMVLPEESAHCAGRGRATAPRADAAGCRQARARREAREVHALRRHHVESPGLCLRHLPRPECGPGVGARIDRQSGRGGAARGCARPIP